LVRLIAAVLRGGGRSQETFNFHFQTSTFTDCIFADERTGIEAEPVSVAPRLTLSAESTGYQLRGWP
jgi:hypothetical protein